jgi:hypothetical protein
MEKFIQFNTLYESVMQDLDSLEEYEVEPILKLTSFEAFKHFCKNINLVTQLSEYSDDDKVVGCSLYFKGLEDEFKQPVKFDYYAKENHQYYDELRDVFEKLEDYKKHYIVTLDGTKATPQVIWG